MELHHGLKYGALLVLSLQLPDLLRPQIGRLMSGGGVFAASNHAHSVPSHTSSPHPHLHSTSLNPPTFRPHAHTPSFPSIETHHNPNKPLQSSLYNRSVSHYQCRRVELGLLKPYLKRMPLSDIRLRRNMKSSSCIPAARRSYSSSAPSTLGLAKASKSSFLKSSTGLGSILDNVQWDK